MCFYCCFPLPFHKQNQNYILTVVVDYTKISTCEMAKAAKSENIKVAVRVRPFISFSVDTQ